MKIKGENVLVIGAGVSGVGAAKLLQKEKVSVTITDQKADFDRESLCASHPALCNVPILMGMPSKEELSSFTLAVVSPGIPLDSAIVTAVSEAGIPLIGEIELAYSFARGRICAVTGTNGKTTTTALLGEMLRTHFSDVHVLGNIGRAYTAEAAEMSHESVTALEISSFQLETIVDFHPQAAAVLNVTPDHLNRYGTMETYLLAKERIIKNQTNGDVIVLNYEDPLLRVFGADIEGGRQQSRPKVVYFSSERVLREGIYLDGGSIWAAKESLCRKIADMSEVSLLGKHNAENICAASALAFAMGVPYSGVRQGLLTFRAVEHRMEFVEEKHGVRYYNDSKATNPDAAIKGIMAMDRPTYLIGGGYDKGLSYDDWIAAFGGRVKTLVLFGATAHKIAACARKCGFFSVVLVSDLREAVSYCVSHAREGEAVLLSPACASWDMYENYEQRGREFKELVRAVE